MRTADYIAQTLVRHGIHDIFLVTGGGAMHLNDAIGRCEGMRYICCHHEQACAMAAEAYARVTGGIGAICVTTGPGGINALNGVFGAWTDSIPMLVVSGQVKRETALYKHGLIGKLRQLGDQEADIVGMVRGITKYAVTIDDPASIRYHLERALYLARSGRPGPVWIDVPIDVQATRIDPAILPAFEPPTVASAFDIETIDTACVDLKRRFASAARPVIMAGKGIRLAGAEALFEALIRRLGVPVVPAWTAIDLVPADDQLYAGLPGDLGSRAGNFTVQNSDLLLVLGSRLGLRQVSYNWPSFARHACLVHVDIDAEESRKPTLHPGVRIVCDVKLFLERMLRILPEGVAPAHAAWLSWCRERVAKYPVVLERQRRICEGRINPYWFMESLYTRLAPDDVIVCANGTANVVGFQTARLRKGQRMFCNTGNASMGYGLPAALGAAAAFHGTRRVICIEGDGSIMMNIQELQTLVHFGLPVKIFVLNNGGYSSIRQSQQAFFGRFVGESAASGLSFPDLSRVASAFGLPVRRIAGDAFAADIEAALREQGPALADVAIDSTQVFEPKLAARVLPDGRIVSPALEDMSPFLDAAELATNMPAELAVAEGART